MAVVTGNQNGVAARGGWDQGDHRWSMIMLTLSSIFVAASVWWILDFVFALREAQPVLQAIAGRSSTPMTLSDWASNDEARAIFCGHPGAPARIDASWAYTPVLALGGVMSLTVGGPLAVLNCAASSRAVAFAQVHRWLAVVIPAVWMTALLVIVLYGHEISILTEVNE